MQLVQNVVGNVGKCFVENLEASQTELDEIEQEMRKLSSRKAEILKELQETKTSIEEILKSAKTKPVAIPISSIVGFDDHSRKCLEGEGIKFLDEIAKKTESEIQGLIGSGTPALGQIRATLSTHGLNFAT